MSYAFISYSHKDSDYAHKLAEMLDRKGFSVWIDDRINYGSNWPIIIQEKLDKCGAFILVMTSNSFKSDWVQNELVRAKSKNKQVFPLLLEGDIWLSVQTIQYVDIRDGNLPPANFFTHLEKHIPCRRNAFSLDTNTSALKKHARREKIENLALELGEVAEGVCRTFEYVRSFNRREDEPDYNQRLQLVQIALANLSKTKEKFVIMLDESNSIDEQVERYSAKYHQLENAFRRANQGQATDRDWTILYSSADGTDEFSRAIKAITGELTELVLKYALSSKD